MTNPLGVFDPRTLGGDLREGTSPPRRDTTALPSASAVSAVGSPAFGRRTRVEQVSDRRPLVERRFTKSAELFRRLRGPVA